LRLKQTFNFQEFGGSFKRKDAKPQRRKNLACARSPADYAKGTGSFSCDHRVRKLRSNSVT
jgi:hypothetical protein